MEIDETSVEFKACVAKVFRKKVWDTIGIWVCVVLVFAWILCLIISCASLIAPPDSSFEEFAFLIARIGSVVGFLGIVAAWLHDVWIDAIKECREIYTQKKEKIGVLMQNERGEIVDKGD